MNSVPRILIFSFVLIAVFGCGKKKSSPLPQSQPAPQNKSACEANCGSSVPQEEASQKEIVKELKDEAPSPGESQLSRGVIANLIQEIRETRLLQTPLNANPAERYEINSQKTRNVTTANTLKLVDLDFDRDGAPSLSISTNEGAYKFKLIESHGMTYQLASTATRWYNPLSWFGEDASLFTATIEARTDNRNVAILELTRHDANFDSKVFIVFLRKFGKLKINYPENFSEKNLHPDSQTLLETLGEVENVTAKFYHVLTEFDEFNSSDATQFSATFDILFSAHSLPNTLTSATDEIPLEKNSVLRGSRKSPGDSLYFRASDINHNNIQSLRQGQMSSLKKISYLPGASEKGIKEAPIASLNLNFRMELKNRIVAKEPTQSIFVTVDF